MASRETQPNPNPIAWIRRSRNFHFRHLAAEREGREPSSGLGTLPKVRFPLEKAVWGAEEAVGIVSCRGQLTWPARRHWSAARARRSGGGRSSSARRRGGTAGSGDLRGAARQHGHTDTPRTHGHAGRGDSPAGSQSKQLVEEGRDRERERAGRMDVPRLRAPSDRVILVGSGRCWDHGNGGVPYGNVPSQRPH